MPGDSGVARYCCAKAGAEAKAAPRASAAKRRAILELILVSLVAELGFLMTSYFRTAVKVPLV